MSTRIVNWASRKHSNAPCTRGRRSNVHTVPESGRRIDYPLPADSLSADRSKGRPDQGLTAIAREDVVWRVGPAAPDWWRTPDCARCCGLRGCVHQPIPAKEYRRCLRSKYFPPIAKPPFGSNDGIDVFLVRATPAQPSRPRRVALVPGLPRTSQTASSRRLHLRPSGHIHWGDRTRDLLVRLQSPQQETSMKRSKPTGEMKGHAPCLRIAYPLVPHLQIHLRRAAGGGPRKLNGRLEYVEPLRQAGGHPVPPPPSMS